MVGAMRAAAVFLLFSAGAALALPPTPNVRPELDLKALAGPLEDLTPEDKKVVDEAIKLIHDNRDADALTSLTKLTRTNPKNTTVRVLRAYALLELGNLAGALSDATFAESSGVPATYKCWFLAQVAYLSGNKPLCRREIKHVSHDPTYALEAEKLHHALDAQSKAK